VVARRFGAAVERTPPRHGRESTVRHDGQGVLAGLPDPLVVGRYHSLAAVAASLPAELPATAWSEDGVVMGVRHAVLPIEGVQFHPESVLTPTGARLLANFLAPRTRPADQAGRGRAPR
jgi:anthranilate/para-aminobenzoate synthase component II